MFNKVNILTALLLSLFSVFAHATADPQNLPSIGSGYADLSNLVSAGVDMGGFTHLNGTIYPHVFANPDELVPTGMKSIGLIMYSRDYPYNDFSCNGNDGGNICNIPVTGGMKLSDAIAKIPTSAVLSDFTMPVNPDLGLKGICAVFYLSPTAGSATAQYFIGGTVCGAIKPPDTSCTITPSELSMSISMSSNSSASANVRGSIECNAQTTVQLITPLLTNSKMSLGGTNGPSANLKINGTPSSLGVDINVKPTLASNFNITADITSGSEGGEFHGSTPLVLIYD